MKAELSAFNTVVGAASFLQGSFTLATLTTAAPGIAGALGFTTTTVVTVPVAAPVILGAGLVLGGHLAYKHLKDNKR
ncbi:hypothetical protein C7B61_08660 [filamentous cyanobacterium CCP1]|jgi:hypothetical protein|nr:hypothetical protein C7B76_29355 [filamentous cyanobacterium CCP2]PSB66955.1 hypothetical protein C7B61_08660 [filamentous cyanobacterium CCP1]